MKVRPRLSAVKLHPANDSSRVWHYEAEGSWNLLNADKNTLRKETLALGTRRRGVFGWGECNMPNVTREGALSGARNRSLNPVLSGI